MFKKGVLEFLVVLVNIVSIQHILGEEIGKFVKKGDKVTLECKDNRASVPVITWRDNIFSDSKIDIFTVDRSGSRKNDQHPQASRFVLNPSSLALEIDNVDDNFVGSYTCSSTNKGVMHNITYNLAVYEPLQCPENPQTSFNNNDTLLYHCRMTFSGREPKITFWKGDKELSKDEAKFSSEVDYVGFDYKHQLTPEDNGQVVVCKAEMDELVEKCEITLDVKYTTRSVTFEPKGDNITVGEKIKCHADGNPAPAILLHEKTKKDKILYEGHGSVSMDVPQEWEDRTVTLHCIAENQKNKPVSQNKVVHVSSPKAGGLHSSSEGRKWSIVLTMSGLLVIVLSFILY